MHPVFSKYRILVPLVLCILFSTKAFPNPLQDTIVLIKQLHLSATKSLEKEDFIEAVKNLNDAHRLTMLPKYNSYKPDIEISIAELYYNLEYYDKAVMQVKEAIQNAKIYRNDYKLAKAYNLYAIILIGTREYSKSEFYLSKANSLAIKLEDPELNAQIIFGQGLLAYRLGNYTDAITDFKIAAKSFNEQSLLYQETAANSSLADALSLIDPKKYQRPLPEARQLLNLVSEVSSSEGFSKFLIENHRIKSQILIAEKRGKLGEEELKYYLDKKDSLRQNHIKVIEHGIQAESTIGDLKGTIANQEKDIKKQEESLFLGKLIGWLSIALILILSLLTLSLYRNNKLRANANAQLKEKNKELIEAKVTAEKASRAKAQFLSTITHELRTPIYTVTGLTHLLLMEDPKPEQNEHLNSLKFSGEYLLSLINNILDINKLDANKVEIENVPFALKKRIDSVLVAMKKSAEEKNNTIHFEYDNTLPDKIIGDSLKITQVLINLISNSIKFTQNGDIWVRVNKFENKLKQVVIHFEVEDNGIGVSKKYQNTIFESFTQGSLQINRKYGGTGLGLSIVKNILELMDSQIHLESELGKGSKFWFKISYGVQEIVKKDKNINEIEVVIENDIFENKSVLIVEDNKINQLITKKILEKKKMICTVVDSGADAINYASETEYDLILMDIHMPGISGVEATQKIREFNNKVPIIALSAITIEENLENFYKAGFNEFIPKPFNTEEFFAKISKVLSSDSLLIK